MSIINFNRWNKRFINFLKPLDVDFYDFFFTIKKNFTTDSKLKTPHFVSLAKNQLIFLTSNLLQNHQATSGNVPICKKFSGQYQS